MTNTLLPLMILALFIVYLLIVRLILWRKLAIENINWQQIKLPNSPNYCLLSADQQAALHSNRVINSPEFNCSASQLTEKLKEILENQPRLQLYRSDSQQQHYVQRSLIFRFPDIITIECHAVDKQHSTVFIYSRSVYGYSDFGVNKKRIQNYLDQLISSLPAKLK